jgi:hypothetical protein
MPLVEDAELSRAPPEPDRLPTLTEVVQLASDPWAAAALAASGKAGSAVEAPPQELPVPGPGPAAALLLVDAAQASPAPAVPEQAAPDEDELTRQVLSSLEQRLDGLFEARLREALAPALARAADGLIRELRPELTQALHDLVHDAVVRALRNAQPR